MGLDREQNQFLEQLYREMYLQLCIYAINALQDQPLAEEAVQDTFRIACAKIDVLQQSENPRGWLTNTLKNVIRNIRRSRAQLSNLLVKAWTSEELSETRPQNAVDFEVTYTQLLGERDYELLKLVVLQKYTIVEASTELGISIEACKKRMQRAKKRLKKIIEKTD